jgi:hypothetical protein
LNALSSVADLAVGVAFCCARASDAQRQQAAIATSAGLAVVKSGTRMSIRLLEANG